MARPPDAAHRRAPGAKTANARGPTAPAHPPHRTSQLTSEQQTFDHDSIGIYHQHWVHCKHQVTTLLLAKAWEGRRHFQDMVMPSTRTVEQTRRVKSSLPKDADLPTGGQPRRRSTAARSASQ